MRNYKITRSLLSLLLSVLILLTSFPIGSVFAATKETEGCVDCSGTGTVECADCVGGYSSTDCTICSGTGLFEENPCEACDGTGKEKCETCGATGFVECLTCNGTGEIEVEYEICPVCNGDKKCTTCAGEGSVKIPCTNSACNNGKIDVDCPDCEDGKIEVSCSNCSGTGKVSKIVSTPCTTCGGTGLLADDSDCPDCEDGIVESLQDVDCDQCVAGKIEQDCSTCDGVGTVQQNCTICGGTGEIDSVCPDCSGDKKCTNCLGTGKIKTVPDTTFAFDDATPSNIKVGDIFENIASSSNNTTGTVSYEVDDDTIAVITNDGKLTAKRVGTVTVTAKIVTDYTFSSAETTYTITIDKATPVISGVSATAITYGQKLSDSTVSAVAKVGTTEIAGRFAWVDSVKNEEPTVVTDSDNTEYEAVFTPDDTDNYTTATFKAKVTVNKADITGITVTGCNHVYDGTEVDAVSVSGLEASDTVKYSTDNGNTYQTSMPKLTNVNDSKTVYVSVSRDGNYNDYVTSVAAEVNPAKIDGVSFDVYSGTYDGTEHQAVTLSGDGYKDGDTVTYTYDGNTYTDLKFKDAGEYEVEVTISRADKNYKDTKFPEETDAKFKVVISKADVTVKANNVSKEYTGEVLTSSNTEASISGEVEGHTFTAQINGSGTTVNEYTLAPSNVVIRDAEGNDVTKNYNISTENGILEITKRPLKITAKNVDAIYNAKPYGENGYLQEGLVEGQTIVALTIDGEKTAVGSYPGLLVPSGAVIKSGTEETTSNYDIEYVSGDMTISYFEIANVNDVYTVNDANDFGWYNDKVILTAKDGYKLCYTNDNADSFTDYVEYTTEGVTKPAIAVMEIATGYITDILDCNQVKIDTVNPNVFDIEYKTPLAYKLLEAVTFGIYNAPTVATVYASDATSNIKSVSYKLTGAEYVDVDVADMTFDEGKYSYDIVIPASFKGQVQYYATDNSGLNSEIKSDDNGIIVDVTNPAIDEIDYNTTIFRDNKYYYSGDAVVDFAVNEEYFFAEYMDSAKIDLKAIDSAVTVKVTKNGEDYTNFEKVLDETSKTISVKIPSLNNDGDYVIDLTYADPAGNSVNVKTDTLVIDTTAPAVTVSYDNNTPSNEKYFNTDRVATITVVEHNFFAEDFIAEFEAKDIKGNDVIVEDYAAKLKNDGEWKHDGDIHTINLEYTVDANYTYSFIGYKDAAENDNEYSFADGSVATNDFVIDHIKPTNVEITYSDSVLEEMLGAVTFGFYKEKCEVTLTTTDATSPIDYFSYSYDVNDPVNTGNVGGSDPNAVAVVGADDASMFTATFEIPAQFRGQVTATATDMATNQSESVTDGKTIVTDTISPVMSVSYSLADNTKNGVNYYNKDITVTLNVTDENFMDGEYPAQVSDIVIKADIEDENKVVTPEIYSVTNWERVNNTDEWVGTFTLSIEGDYTLSISYADKSGNTVSYTNDDYKITIDKTAPVVTVSYDNNTVNPKAKDNTYFDEARTATITVVEHNFAPEYIDTKIIVNDILTAIDDEMGITTSVAEKLKGITDYSNWNHNGNTHTFTLEYKDDAIYDFSLTSFKDYALNEMNPENDNKVIYADETVSPEHFVVDQTKPSDVVITYSSDITVFETILQDLFWFYNPNKNSPCVVTLTTTDMTSGIQYFTYSYAENDDVIDVQTENIEDLNVEKEIGFEQNAENLSEFTYSFEIPAQFRGKVKATATDNSGNTTAKETESEKTIVVDTEPAKLNVDYSAPSNPAEDNKYGINYYSDDVTVTVTVEEENFMDGEYSSEVNDIVISADIEDENKVVTSENYSVTDWTRDTQTKKWVGTFTLSTEGDYTLSISYADKSGNTVFYTNDDYKITIDKIAPIIEVTYDNEINSNRVGEGYFLNRTATITVVEHNFDEDSFYAEITAKNITSDISTIAQTALNENEWTDNGNIHTLVIPYTDDAIYTFALNGLKDLAKNDYATKQDNDGKIYKKDTETPDIFTVDETKPENLEISYSLPVVQQIFERLTFGFYQGPCIVTLTAEDNVSSVQYFTYRYDVTQDSVNPDDKGKAVEEAKATSSETTAVNGKGTLTFKIPAQFRGKVSATAVNNCGVETEKLIDENNRIVVDNISPILSVSYNSEGKVNFTKGENHEDAKDFASADQAYYDKLVVSTITIDEANFFEGKQKYVIDEDNERQEDGFVHQVGIQLVKTDNNGNISKIEYLPQGTDNLFDDSTATEIINWNNNGTKHSFTIKYDADADYKLVVKYESDFSSNSTVIEDASTTESSIMSEYTYESKTITVDTIAPEVSVIYEPNPKAIHTIDGREYFDSNRSATITVNEHNFRASDFETKDLLLANNILGNEVTNYISYFKDEKNWTTDAKDPTGNTHIIKIDFKSDANYTFDFSFVDLAKNACADYDADLFTVDKTAPKNLKVSYSTSVFDTVINAITFGYYDKKMTVTISADDDTSGIYHFMYSYLIADGVSKVNTELVNDAIKHAKITLNGKTSTATFNIPKSELTNQNQFNGTVEFTAYDFAENSTYKEDNKRVIVDNISPTATISYNNPVQNANNISYYSGDINATIVINEANFYKEDVVVTVSKNGSDSRINPKWIDNSVDKHTGTFTLSGDGDYVVKISYADRSGNKMADYKSNQLTIDTKDPVITVSGIKNQSANNDETIGFSISIADRNIPQSGINPTLTAVIRDDNGQLNSITIDLGAPTISTDSQGNTVYTYTVTNLDIDGYYSLNCSALDYANHSVALINSEQDNGGNASEQTLNFSVNREGSAFWIETHHNYINDTKDIVDELDGKYVNGEVEITIHEVNVDKIDIFDEEEQRTSFTLNDGNSANDISLVEGTNYTKNTSIGEGGWYETEYSLNNNNFDHDGTYSFNILTYDRAGNSNVNTKDSAGSIKFTVDRTNPVITSNVVTKQVIDADEFVVEFKVNDVNPDDQTVEVSLNNILLDEEQVESLGNNTYSFKIKNGSNQTFKISTVDLATNNSDKYEIEQVTVSTNKFILFYYSHTALFWIIIASIVVVASGTIFIIFKRRNKNGEDE